jgi:hypothetical protein
MVRMAAGGFGCNERAEIAMNCRVVSSFQRVGSLYSSPLMLIVFMVQVYNMKFRSERTEKNRSR